MVQARDQYGNETGWSIEIRALTLGEVTQWENGDLTLDDILGN